MWYGNRISFIVCGPCTRAFRRWALFQQLKSINLFKVLLFFLKIGMLCCFSLQTPEIKAQTLQGTRTGRKKNSARNLKEQMQSRRNQNGNNKT
jgi:hypothetical protein